MDGKRDFCFGDWCTLVTVFEMSNIGATFTFGPKIRRDDGCHVLSCLGMNSRTCIDIQRLAIDSSV